jgi:DNA modification methylase
MSRQHFDRLAKLLGLAERLREIRAGAPRVVPLPVTPAVLVGDCRELLPTLPAASFRCCMTSPPYWGMRDYEHPKQLGLEPDLDSYVSNLVDVMRAVRRVLRDDGTLWLNVGDGYSSGGRQVSAADARHPRRKRKALPPPPRDTKPKDLLGIPWLVAFALRADGWYLRSAIVFRKTNLFPESVKDRPTLDYEHVFLFAKSETYFYDAKAIRERVRWRDGRVRADAGRNARAVWDIRLDKSSSPHPARFPIELPRRCILAGSAPGDAVLDPFAGAGTTGRAAIELGRSATLIELNASYLP